jgi:isoamyl acetate esterase
LKDELGILKIDVRSAIKQAGDFSELISEDGIHLTAKGYRVFSQEVFQGLTAVFDL